MTYNGDDGSENRQWKKEGDTKDYISRKIFSTFRDVWIVFRMIHLKKAIGKSLGKSVRVYPYIHQSIRVR